MRKLGVPLAVLRLTVNMFAPGPSIVMPEPMSGSAVVKLMVPATPLRSIVSHPLLLPATHSPASTPEATSPFAAVMASRKEHSPSVLLATSDVLVTVMLAVGVISL